MSAVTAESDVKASSWPSSKSLPTLQITDTEVPGAHCIFALTAGGTGVPRDLVFTTFPAAAGIGNEGDATSAPQDVTS